MKKFKSKLSARAGFSLVELIVVIIILAILAAIAVPTYAGYIKRAKDASDLELLGVINTAAQACAAGEQAAVERITVTASDGTISAIEVTCDTSASISDADMMLLLGVDDYGELELKGSYADGAVWEDGDWSAGIPTG